MAGAKIESPQRVVQRVIVEQATLKVLRREAAQRDTSVDRLITELLNVTAADDLVAAVLDDKDLVDEGAAVDHGAVGGTAK